MSQEPAQQKNAVFDDRWDHSDDSVHNAALSFPTASPSGALHVREMEDRDLDAACDLCIAAFGDFNESIGASPDFPPRHVMDVPKIYYGRGTAEQRQHGGTGFASFVVVDEAGTILGANLLEVQDGVAGIGPLCSNTPGAGKLLMQAVMKAAAERDVRAVRLLQVSANTRSFSLYLSLGFEARRVNLQYTGSCTAEMPGGIAVARLTEADVDECSALHDQICGTARKNDIAASVGSPHPNSVARGAAGTLLAYTTGSYNGGHTVALTEEAFMALVVAQSSAVAAAQAAGAPIPPMSLFLPLQHSHLARWLASNGLRLNRQLVSMSYGPHPEPVGGFYLPSISY